MIPARLALGRSREGSGRCAAGDGGQPLLAGDAGESRSSHNDSPEAWRHDAILVEVSG
jgi:hypothetical protein